MLTIEKGAWTLAAIASLCLAGCQSSVPAGGPPLISPNLVTATIDGRSWTSDSITASFQSFAQQFRLVAVNPTDSLATQLKLVLAHVNPGAGTYQVIDTTGSEEVTLRSNQTWTTGSAGGGYYVGGFYPSYGTITFTQLDATRAIGSFSINPAPHTTSGTFDIALK